MARMCGKETAAGLPCVFEGDHDPPCMDVRGKRHFVLKAELGALRGLPPHLVGAAGLNVPPGARFMVNIGGGRAQPIFQLEEVLDEKRKEMERDRLLATTIAAWAYATQRGRAAPPTGVAALAADFERVNRELHKLKEQRGRAVFIVVTADGSMAFEAVDEEDATAQWAKVNEVELEQLPDELTVARASAEDYETLLELVEEGSAAKRELEKLRTLQ